VHHIDHLTGVEEGTVSRNRRIHEDHLAPSIGRAPVADLTRDDVVLQRLPSVAISSCGQQGD